MTFMVEQPRLKLGKKDPRPHPNTLQLKDFLRADRPPLPMPPAKSYWEYKIGANDWGMFGNDQFGDCFWAYIAHQIMSWTAHTGKIIMPSLDDVLKAYGDVTGFKADDPSTDNGTVATEGYEYWRTVGVGGHKIDGWVAIDKGNDDHVALGNYLFGGLGQGVLLPQQAQNQFYYKKPWELVTGDTVEGGHMILMQGKGSAGSTIVTWGNGRQQVLKDWFVQQTDELYAAVSLDWLDATGVAPSHVNLEDLRTACAELKQG